MVCDNVNKWFTRKYLKKTENLTNFYWKTLKRCLIPTISPTPGLRFSPNLASYSNDSPYCLLPSCKRLETFNERFGGKMPKNPTFWHLIPLNPWIKILFFKNMAVSLFLLYWPLTSCIISEKTNERSLRYFKTDHGPWTNERTEKGDYIGPCQVNLGSISDI